jgi:hypothetical protein
LGGLGERHLVRVFDQHHGPIILLLFAHPEIEPPHLKSSKVGIRRSAAKVHDVGGRVQLVLGRSTFINGTRSPSVLFHCDGRCGKMKM